MKKMIEKRGFLEKGFVSGVLFLGGLSSLSIFTLLLLFSGMPHNAVAQVNEDPIFIPPLELPSMPEMNYDPCKVIDPETDPEVNIPSLCDMMAGFEPTSDDYVFPGGLQTTMTSGTYTGKNFYIRSGIWAITASVRFINCNFLMGPGTGIVVGGSYAEEVVFEGCNFFSCDKMWTGIHVANGPFFTTFLFYQNRVEDAVTGLRIFTGPKNAALRSFGIGNNLFVNNYIGLSNFWTMGFKGRSMLYNFLCNSNRFLASGNLRSPTIDDETSLLPPNNVHPLAFAGMVLNKLDLSENSLTFNNFQNMVNGQVLTDVNVTNMNSDFKAPIQFGINARNTDLLVTSGCTFTNVNNSFMETGIYARSCHLTVEDSRFLGAMLYGISSEENLNMEQILIKNNFFNQKSGGTFQKPINPVAGIAIERSAALSGVTNQIIENRCECSPSDELQNYACVLVGGRNTATDEMHIKGQDITFALKNGYFNVNGIVVQSTNSDNYQISNKNTVRYTGDYFSVESYGINFSVLRSRNNHIDQNDLYGKETIEGEQPYNVDCNIHNHINFSDVSLCENMVNKGRHGLHFPGGFQERSYPIISGNTIGDHSFGMFIDAGVVVGYHDGSGNRWTGQYNYYAAEKRGPLSTFPTDPISVRFRVPESNTLPYLPPGNLLKPNPDLEPITDRKWFRYDNQIPTNYCTPVNPGALLASELKIVQGTSTLAGAELKENEQNLYRRLIENPGWVTGVLIQQKEWKAGQKMLSLDISNAAPGIYAIVFCDENGRYQHTLKVMLQRP